MPHFLSFIALSIPFQIALSPLVGFDIALIRILILGAALTWCAQILVTKRFSLTSSVIPFLIILFLFLTFLSSFVAYDLIWFARKLIFLLNFFALFFVIIGTLHSWDAAEKLLRVTLYGGIFAAGIALIFWIAQFIVGAETVMTLWRTIIAPLFLGQTFAHTVATYSSAYVNIAGTNYLRAVGFFPDPHVAAFFFELLIPFAVAHVFTAPTRRSMRLWFIGTILLISATLVTFTRGAYVALFVGALFALLILIIRAQKVTFHKILLYTLSVICITSVVIFSTPLGDRMYSIISNHDSSINQRLLIWEEALSIITDRPILGVGLGNYPLMVAPHADYRDPYYAHNLYLDIAVETGILTALVWSMLILVALARFLRHHPHAYGLAGATSLVILSVHGFFDTMLFSVHVLPLLIIILAFSTYKKTSSC